MTHDEKRAQLGVVLVEIRETQKEINAITVSLERIGGDLYKLSRALQSYPHLVNSLPEPGAEDFRECLNCLDKERVLRLTAELKSLKSKLRQLEDQESRLS